MQVTTKGIVLSSIKYGDTSLISRIYTDSDGLKSYLLKGILTAKKGKLKAAYFQPLMQLEINANHKNKGTLESIRDVKVEYHYQSLHTEMTKNSVVLFLAEMLGNSIHEEESNKELFQFLQASLQWLDNHDKIANFHLFFLLSLTKYLGFYPDTENFSASCFDLVDGVFVDYPSGSAFITDENLVLFKQLLGTNFDTIHSIIMKKTNRQELLKSIVLYYEMHLQGFRKPKSLAVLNEVFS
ncbi:DNA repair protein RecO [Aurantibacter crassamenti]|uniref:DNA repair protein RecO n=1 Tax=Aurantibacter crassamenti TaxID=1837375 RepID=UPI0019399A46|nr:DNA repair protein RecO [Aurantibacter crassamenti]MBM1104914.1 DNA repair protein RecO [Aurantibacter crassamenti]